jgi:son of sevenless-like protein
MLSILNHQLCFIGVLFVISEGKLKVIDKNRRLVDRHVILCDSMILVLKHLTGKRSSVSSYQGHEFRLREKHLIRKVDVLDRDDSSGESHTFELAPRDQPKIVFKAESEEEKNSWMAALVMLNTKFMLERLLDGILLKEDKKHPLRLPPVSEYRFAEPNSDKNILFEQKGNSSGVPMVKVIISCICTFSQYIESTVTLCTVGSDSGETCRTSHISRVRRPHVHENLSHHIPEFLHASRTSRASHRGNASILSHTKFLWSCFMPLQRFNIPDPEFSSDSESDSEAGSSSRSRMEALRQAQNMKRFRKTYSQPVQFRVVNVLKHWVDQHWYDFEQDPQLLYRLNGFLQEISGKHMKKWVERISTLVQRKVERQTRFKRTLCKQSTCPQMTCDSKEPIVTLDRSPPPIEHHIDRAEDESWPELLTV